MDINMTVQGEKYSLIAIKTVFDIRREMFDNHGILLTHILANGSILIDKAPIEKYINHDLEGIPDENEYEIYKEGSYRCKQCRRNFQEEILKCVHDNFCKMKIYRNKTCKLNSFNFNKPENPKKESNSSSSIHMSLDLVSGSFCSSPFSFFDLNNADVSKSQNSSNLCVQKNEEFQINEIKPNKNEIFQTPYEIRKEKIEKIDETKIQILETHSASEMKINDSTHDQTGNISNDNLIKNKDEMLKDKAESTSTLENFQEDRTKKIFCTTPKISSYKILKPCLSYEEIFENDYCIFCSKKVEEEKNKKRHFDECKALDIYHDPHRNRISTLKLRYNRRECKICVKRFFASRRHSCCLMLNEEEREERDLREKEEYERIRQLNLEKISAFELLSKKEKKKNPLVLLPIPSERKLTINDKTLCLYCDQYFVNRHHDECKWKKFFEENKDVIMLSYEKRRSVLLKRIEKASDWKNNELLKRKREYTDNSINEKTIIEKKPENPQCLSFLHFRADFDRFERDLKREKEPMFFNPIILPATAEEIEAAKGLISYEEFFAGVIRGSTKYLQGRRSLRQLCVSREDYKERERLLFNRVAEEWGIEMGEDGVYRSYPVPPQGDADIFPAEFLNSHKIPERKIEETFLNQEKTDENEILCLATPKREEKENLNKDENSFSANLPEIKACDLDEINYEYSEGSAELVKLYSDYFPNIRITMIIQYAQNKNYVAKLNGKIIGAINFQIMDLAKIKFSYIVLLCVDENHRRKGIAKNLWKEAIESCENRGVVWVDNNKSALQFYKSVGTRRIKKLWFALQFWIGQHTDSFFSCAGFTEEEIQILLSYGREKMEIAEAERKSLKLEKAKKKKNSKSLSFLEQEINLAEFVYGAGIVKNKKAKTSEDEKKKQQAKEKRSQKKP